MPSSRKIATGAFVFAGLFLFVLGLFWIGERRFLFSRSIELYAEFRNVSGLKNGARVAVSGMDAGEVLLISAPADPDAKFRIRFRVLEKFRPILRADSVATIQTDGLVGNKLLQVDPGSKEAAVAQPGDTIASREPVDLADMVREAVETVQYARAAIDDIKGGVQETVENLAGINKAAIELIDDVGNEVAKITASSNKAVDGVNEIVDGVKQGKGTVGKLFNDDQLYQDVRGTVSGLERTTENLSRTSNDVRVIVDDIQKRDIGRHIELTLQEVQELSVKGREAVSTLLPQSPGEEGLASSLRNTLANANEVMSDMAENSEALKRSWFFRGFFNQRGFFDMDSVSVADYQQGRFAPRLRPERRSVPAADLFASGPDGAEVLTEEGKRRLDLAMADFLQHTRNTPLMVEGHANQGSEAEQFLKSHARAVLVRNYLMSRFSLKSNYVGFMPLGAGGSPDGTMTGADGVSLVLFTDRSSARR